MRLHDPLESSLPRRAAAAGLLALLLALSCGKKDGAGTTQPPTTATATLVGLTLGTSGGGLPLAGVEISASPSAAEPVTSNSFGTFSLKIPANTPVAIRATHGGFAEHPLTVQLAEGETRAVTLVLPVFGASATVTAASGGKVTDAGAHTAVTLPPGFVTGTSTAVVSVTGLDPTGEQALAMPGTFAAENAFGTVMTLAPGALAEVRVGDGAGTSFPLAQPLVLEMHVPASLQGDKWYFPGSAVPCFTYDAASGRWKFYGNGSVATSSVDGEPCVRLTVTHLSWFAAGYLNGSSGCVSGVVLDGSTPVAGVTVQAFPGGSDVTKADGSYRVSAPSEAPVQLLATRPITAGVEVGSGSATAGAAGSGCTSQALSLQNAGPPPSYTVAAQLMRGRDAVGVPRDQMFAKVTVGAGAVPLDGAVVQIGDGAAVRTLPLIANGLYGRTTGFSLIEGAIYTLRVDFEPDGVFDATAQVTMPGRPAILTPAAGSLMEPSFTATWTDPASATPGYTAHYIGSVESLAFGTFPARFVADAPAAGYPIGTGTGQPAYFMTNDPLPAGGYLFRLWATNGPVRYPVDATHRIFEQPNVATLDLTVYFSAISQADSVSFSSLGSETRPAAIGVARR